MPASLHSKTLPDLQLCAFTTGDRRALLGMAAVLVVVTISTLVIAAWPVQAEPVVVVPDFIDEQRV